MGRDRPLTRRKVRPFVRSSPRQMRGAAAARRGTKGCVPCRGCRVDCRDSSRGDARAWCSNGVRPAQRAACHRRCRRRGGRGGARDAAWRARTAERARSNGHGVPSQSSQSSQPWSAYATSGALGNAYAPGHEYCATPAGAQRGGARRARGHRLWSGWRRRWWWWCCVSNVGTNLFELGAVRETKAASHPSRLHEAEDRALLRAPRRRGVAAAATACGRSSRARRRATRGGVKRTRRKP